jgi:N6-L-threonylcarbamoyladenine synthase
MNILAIETSCDETAVALVKSEKGGFFVRDEYISSQIKIHAPFGGVVPNLAGREHLKNLPILLEKLLKKNRVSSKYVDLIAVTQGPGLIPALLIGTNAAKALSYAWKKPLVGVNHVVGHVYASYARESSKLKAQSSKFGKIKFPALALVVSGGHTELILMKKHMDFKILGQTLDDAAGEAFDKVAKILGLGYPGGPEVAALADKFRKTHKVRPFPFPTVRRKIPQDQTFRLPRPMIKSSDLNFSFSGLKTAVLYTVRDNPDILKSKKLKAQLCAEFQQAAIDVLVSKTIRAAKKHKPKMILMGGGVSANKELRRQLCDAIKSELPSIKYQIPNTKYSLDNAAMIAVAGYFKWKFSKNRKPFYNNWRNLEADASFKLK